jgi:hypothetical protein
LFPALSVNVSVPVRFPGAPGVNVTPIAQLLPAATCTVVVAVDTHVFAVIAKSVEFVPPTATLVTVNAPVPEFVSVIVCAALVVLTFWLPKK